MSDDCTPSDDWVYEDPPDLGVFVTSDVYQGGEPVLLVSHDEDGDWAFSGTMGFDVEDDDILLLHLGWVVANQPDMAAVADLPRGWAASRDAVGLPWHRFVDQPADE